MAHTEGLDIILWLSILVRCSWIGLFTFFSLTRPSESRVHRQYLASRQASCRIITHSKRAIRVRCLSPCSMFTWQRSWLSINVILLKVERVPSPGGISSPSSVYLRSLRPTSYKNQSLFSRAFVCGQDTLRCTCTSISGS